MDYGLSENDFWSMSIAEVNRFVESAKRKEQRKAEFDYVLADLIGRSVARVYNASNKLPTLAEAYPTLFSREEEQEEIQNRKDEISIIRFRQFVDSHNKKFGGDSNK